MEIMDEGLWAHSARSAALFQQWAPDQVQQGLAVGPLFSAALYVVYRFSGVGFVQTRLLSAFSGWLILVCVYILVKRQWRNRRLALYSLVLLGLNHAFVNYNRLGLPESFQILWVTLTFLFWLEGREHTGFYYLSGVSFGLVFLTKNQNFLYLLPALMLLGTLEFARGELRWASLLRFALGIGPIIVAYILFFFFNYDQFLPTLEYARNWWTPNLSMSLGNIFMFFASWGEVFFGRPSINYLAALVILYLLGKMPAMLNNWHVWLQSLSSLEIVCISWLLGNGLFTAIFDLNLRRFMSLVVPLSILSAKVIVDGSDLRIDHLVTAFGGTHRLLRAVLNSMLLLFFACVVVYRALGIIRFTTETMISLDIRLGIASALTVTLIALLVSNKVGRGILSNPRTVVVLLLGYLVIVPLGTSVKSLLYPLRFLGVTEPAALFPLLVVIAGALPFVLLGRGAIVRGSMLTPKVSALVTSLYFGYNIAMLVVWLGWPTFTLYEASRTVGHYVQRGEAVTGSTWTHELSLENESFPMFQSDVFKGTEPVLGEHIRGFWTRFYLGETSNGSRPTGVANTSNFVELERIELFPFPLTQKATLKLSLFEIR